MQVRVISQNGKRLMPTNLKKAKALLKAKKAKLVPTLPITIRLLYPTTEHIQERKF